MGAIWFLKICFWQWISEIVEVTFIKAQGRKTYSDSLPKQQ